MPHASLSLQQSNQILLPTYNHLINYLTNMLVTSRQRHNGSYSTFTLRDSNEIYLRGVRTHSEECSGGYTPSTPSVLGIWWSESGQVNKIGNAKRRIHYHQPNQTLSRYIQSQRPGVCIAVFRWY